MPYSFSELAKRRVNLDVSQLLAGVAIDPSFGASVAFVAPGVEPAAADWVAATWQADWNSPTGGQYALSVLVGPADGTAPIPDVTLAQGTWAGWVKVNTGAELYVGQVDTVTVTGANQAVPVVTVEEMSTYMGYPFRPEQTPAVADVVAQITGELQTRLRADLSVQTWTELYTIPWERPQPFSNSYLGYSYASLYPDTDQFNLVDAVGDVRLKHWPVVEWVALSVNTSASAATSATDPNASWVPVTPPVAPQELPQFTPGTQVMVTYKAGWDGPNLDDIKGVIKRAAARELTNRLDDAVGMKGFSTVRLPDGNGNEKVTPGLSDDEVGRLSRYRKRVVV